MQVNPEMIKSAAGSIGGGGDATWDDIYAQQANSFTQYIDDAKDQQLLKNSASVGTSAPVQTEEKKTDETEGGDEVVRTEVETTTINKETGVETIESKITFKDGAYYGI